MRGTASSAVVIAAAFSGQALATIGWLNAPVFHTPENTANTCNDHQKGGFNWTNLQAGGFSAYGGFDFSGFECSNKWGASLFAGIGKRTSQDKCITGSISKSTGPSLSCGTHDFSIDTMDVSAEFDTDIDCIYTMPDSSVCKETHSCSKSGSTIKNSQCGGAKSVSFQLPSAHASSSCSIGVHTIGFNCGSSSSTIASVAATSTDAFPSSYGAASSQTTIPAYQTSVIPSSHGQSSQAQSSAAQSLPAASSTNSPTYHVPIPIAPSSARPLQGSSIPASSGAPSYAAPSSVAKTTAHTSAVISSVLSAASSGSPSSFAVPSSIISTPASSTTVVSAITTYCSGPTTITHGSRTYSVTEATTLTITDCPCTLTSAAPGDSSTGVSILPSATSAVLSSIAPVPVTTIKTYTSTSTCSSGQVVSTIVTTPFVSTATATSTITSVSTPESAAPITVTQMTTFVTTTSCTSGQTVETTLTAPSESTVTVVATETHTTAAIASMETTAAQQTFTTEVVQTSTTTCSAGQTITQGGSTTILASEIISTVYVTKDSSLVSSVQPAVPTPTAAAPDVLPRCLNTWLGKSGCKSNTDSDCYCKDSAFAENVMQCLKAYGASGDEISKGVNMFQGVCVSYISQNPAIVTAAPSSYQAPSAGPSASTGASSAESPSAVSSVVAPALTEAPACPQTTITYHTTITGSSTSTVVSTVLTIPQVSFTTGSSSSVGLMPATTPATYPTSAVSGGVASGVSPSAQATPSSLAYGGNYRPTSTPALYTGAADRAAAGGFVGAAAVAAGVVLFL